MCVFVCVCVSGGGRGGEATEKNHVSAKPTTTASAGDKKSLMRDYRMKPSIPQLARPNFPITFQTYKLQMGPG